VPQIWLKRAFGVTASVIYVATLGAAIVALAVWGSWSVCCLMTTPALATAACKNRPGAGTAGPPARQAGSR